MAEDPNGLAQSETWRRLLASINELESVVVAFSGGVDSSLLYAAAWDALGARALGVTACSPSYPEHERRQAAEIAAWLGAPHRFIETSEHEDPAYSANPPNRCYYCKSDLFGALDSLAKTEGLGVVLDGSNADDESDYRPGRTAALELGVRAPLAELGIGKDEIRRLSKARGLPNWDQPACACLASRIPYGETITPARLDRIGRTEFALRTVGFRKLRVRDHDSLARVEVGPAEIDRAMRPEIRAQIVATCKAEGYLFVCLDLEGYRLGSMNEALPGINP